MWTEIKARLYSVINIESQSCHHLGSNFALYNELRRTIINYPKLNTVIKIIRVFEGRSILIIILFLWDDTM
jgi:hypothetical protein